MLRANSSRLQTLRVSVLLVTLVALVCIVYLRNESGNRLAPIAESGGGPLEPHLSATSSTSLSAEAVPVRLPAPKALGDILQGVSDPDNVAQVSRAALERFVTMSKRSSASLLTAWSESRDRRWLEEAAGKYPNDPAVELAVLLAGDLPNERNPWLARLRRTSPDNPLVNYIAADACFKAGDRAGGLNELRQAMGKSTYEDFSGRKIADRESLYLASLSDPLEAKIRAVTGYPLDAIPIVRAAAKALLTIEEEAKSAGDVAAEVEAAQLGVDIGRALAERADGPLLLQLLVGARLEIAALDALGEDADELTLGYDPFDRRDELKHRVAEISKLSAVLRPGKSQYSAADLEEYFAHAKSEGELFARRWLSTRISDTTAANP